MVIARGGYPHPGRFPGQPLTTPTGPLTLADLVDADQVHALLVARTPKLLTTTTGAAALALITKGVAAEVLQILGTLPAPGPTRDLAVWCVTLGVAANIESSAFPEQGGLSDSGRAQLLQARYLGVRAQLIQAVADDPTLSPGGLDGSGNGAGARWGGFLAATAYPDPAGAPAFSYGAGFAGSAYGGAPW